ncbi:MAG TPA: DJ-1/PfpI/YhbO family deglycase/protease [bacterium]|nr:DJ-1/PfpI/YhbO family deglycase/protease [bacterium]HPR87372.1 DJ-1/PfpI/YhbO family deglycase/protease [bacterium]
MLQGKRIAILIGPQFHDEEATIPRAWLQERGAAVDLIGLERSELTGKYGKITLTPDLGIAEAIPEEYDGLIIPGGGAPERIRVDDRALAFVKNFWQTGRPVGAICHGPQVLISAELLGGLTMTCYVGIRDDVKLAGAHYVDREVCVDGQLITSRKPEDLPAFNKAFTEALAGAAESKMADALTALALAISREKGAQEFYAGVAEVLHGEALRNKFRYLALTEEGHYDQLADLYEKIAHKRPEAVLMATEISGKSVSPQITALEALDLAVAAEQKAYEYYRQMALRATSNRAREMFEYLAAEEMEHKRLLSIDKSLLQGGQGHFQWATHFDTPPGMEDLW